MCDEYVIYGTHSKFIRDKPHFLLGYNENYV